MEKAKKRFVISFSDSVESLSDMAQILLIDESQFLNSVEFYQGIQEVNENDIIYYDGLGQVSLELSNAEAANLRKTKGVFAVDEDIELAIAEGNGVFPPEQLDFLKKGRSNQGLQNDQRGINYSEFVNREEDYRFSQQPVHHFKERNRNYAQGEFRRQEQMPPLRNEIYPNEHYAFENNPPVGYQEENWRAGFPQRSVQQRFVPNHWEQRAFVEQNRINQNYQRPIQPYFPQNEHFQNRAEAPPVSEVRAYPNRTFNYLPSNTNREMSMRTNERYYQDEFMNEDPTYNQDQIHIPPPRKSKQLNWNIRVIEADRSWNETTGKGVNVAVFDTGVAQHKDLQIFDGVSFVPQTKSFNDLHGHGTHVSGIIASRNRQDGNAGIAPDAKLFAVKILDDSGKGKMTWLLAGMSWAMRSKMNVISIGCSAPKERIAAFDVAVEKCNELGISVVCPAGNSNKTEFPEVNAPANSFGVIAVGAIDRNYRSAEFSSRGGSNNPVSITAPGTGILSTNLNNGYSRKSGTSMASPHVVGLIALLKEKYPSMEPEDIKERINQTASDLGYPENDPVYGAGLINCFRAIR